MKGAVEARAASEGKPVPDGYNVGFNVGEAAGQTVFHLHVHVVPRYRGDVADPRGGVRLVIPERGNYRSGSYKALPGDPWNLRDSRAAPTLRPAALEPPPPRLAGGLGSALEGPLLDDLARAHEVFILVAFTLPSGVAIIKQELENLLLRRGGELTFITGDYRDVTDPRALRDLMALREAHRERCRVFVYETGAGHSFHPKSYLFVKRPGQHAPLRAPTKVGYVGSSNLTRTALGVDGVEWNLRVTGGETDALRQEFQRILDSPSCEPLTYEWIEEYEKRRQAPLPPSWAGNDRAPDVELEEQAIGQSVPQEVVEPITPRELQAQGPGGPGRRA